MFFVQYDLDTPLTEMWGLCPLPLNLCRLLTRMEKMLLLRLDHITGDTVSAWLSWDTHSWNPATTLGLSLSSL